MQLIQIDNLNDARLIPYRNLKTTNQTRWSRSFIAEGKWVVQRLVSSGFEVDSILVASSKLNTVKEQLTIEAPWLVVPDPLVKELVGFDFHQGVMACGVRNTKQSTLPFDDLAANESLFVACPFTTLPDNLGSIIRISAALSASGVIVSSRSSNPFSRRVIRVSMGNVFNIPVIEPEDFEAELLHMKQRGHELVGSVVQHGVGQRGGVPVRSFRRSDRTVLLLGNEAIGLESNSLDICDRLVTIPMRSGIDSLNVADALAILLHELVPIDEY